MLSEIQGHIFAFNSVGDAYNYARVCKGWLERALDHVWHEVDDVKVIFRLLAPLVYSEEDDDVMVCEMHS